MNIEINPKLNLEQDIALLVSKLTLLLIKQNSTLVCAESCTGGWLSKYCTDIAGSSSWFEGGVVSYSDALKKSLLKVPEKTLQQHGAVSEATAQAMAVGACQLVNAKKTHVGVSITGIAGPGGGSADKPVGMVCFAWARWCPPGNTEQTVVETVAETLGQSTEILGVDTQFFAGNRNEIRKQSVHYALKGLLVRLVSA